MADWQWTSAARSHPGRVRQVNEDAGLEQPRRGVWAVADGMGGHSLGEFASRVAVRGLIDLPPSDELEDRIATAKTRLQEANRRLREEATRRDVPMIGTTIVALLASGDRCACVWAGDSRVYLYRAGRLRQLTRDHSQLEAARARHVASGDVTMDRPASNVITRAVGGADTLVLDDVVLDLADGDVFLLCSDGLSGEVSELAIEQALLTGNCRSATETLVDQALERGGHDNITVVVVRADDLGSPDRTALHPALA